METAEIIGLIILGIGGVLGVAKIVTKFTKTEKDDEMIEDVTGLWQKISEGILGVLGKKK